MSADFTKLAEYLDSFEPGDPNYDRACYIKYKIGFFPIEDETQSEDLDDAAVTDNPEDADKRTDENLEGSLLEPAFKDLELQNQMEKEQDKVVPTDGTTNASQNSNGMVQKIMKQSSLFDELARKFAK